MAGRRRHARVITVLVAVAVALAVDAAPVGAVGSKPVVTVVHPGPTLFAAGEGCAFDVSGQPDAKALVVVTEFSDGRVTIVANAHPTLTNLATGASLVQHSSYIDTEVPLGPHEVRGSGSGKVVFSFFPGDRGPIGIVGVPGALLSLTGQWRYTYDPDTGVLSSFSLTGTAKDLCAALGR